MTYLSRPDRRAETEPAEDRELKITVESVSFVRMDRCLWCSQPIRKHGTEALARCEAAFQAEMNRRMAGPVRVRDMAGGRA